MPIRSALFVFAALLCAAPASGAERRKAPPTPAAAAAHPLEGTFAQGAEAERLWTEQCPARHSLAVGETRALELGAAKVLSEEVPIVTLAAPRSGRVRAKGVGVGLTALRVRDRRGGEQVVCIRVVAPASAPVGFDSAELPSPGPCALPKATRALLRQSASLEPGARMLLPMPKWKRFSVDAPVMVKVTGAGPDELVLEARGTGTTQLRVCHEGRVEVIDLEVGAQPSAVEQSPEGR